MSKTKSFLILCAILTFMGLVLAGTGFLLGGRVTGAGITHNGLKVFTLNNPDGSDLVGTLTDDDLESFSNIRINVNYCDVSIKESDHFSLETHLSEKRKINYEVKDDTLILTQSKPSVGWTGNSYLFMWGLDPSVSQPYNYIVLTVPNDFPLEKISLHSESGDTFLDSLSAGDVDIQNEYGDIELANIDCDALSLSTESGDIDFRNVTSRSAILTDDYGDVHLQDVGIAASLSVDMESGSCALHAVSAATADIRNLYGDVDGNGVTLDSAVMKLESGECSVTGFSFENIDLNLDYGSAMIRSVKPISSYGLDLYTDYGEITIDGREIRSGYPSIEEGSKNYIRVICESGDIDLYSD